MEKHTGEEYLLEVKNVCKSFPGVQALENVNFSLKKGEVHALIGENGAGKSTLIKILSGAYHLDSGEISVNGQQVTIDNPRKAFDLGITVIYQELNLNPFLPIYENVFLGREFRNKFGLLNSSKAIKETKKLLAQCGLDISPKTIVKDLGVAQQQLVEIAKAMSLDANIIIFDEPTSALSDKEIECLFARIRELKEAGCGIIYVSHRLEEIFEIANRCTVLRDGEYIGTREVKNVDIKELINMIVGRKFSESKRTETYVYQENVLKVKGLDYKNILKNISFELKKGEILGIAGLMGSGRTELAKCIIGEFKKTSGDIYLHDTLVTIKSVNEALKYGIVYLSEDRRSEGLFLKHHVKTNMTISSLAEVVRRGLLSFKKEVTLCSDLRDKLRIKTPSLATLVKNLSGGNQQKVVIGRWLLTKAKVFIFDEPTRGIDVGAKDEIHKIMEELVKEGASIMMISSEIPEILKMSDRIMVMRFGSVEMILDNHNLTQEDILHYAIGAHKLNYN
jgi:ribose transport system ATP-binding protein